MTLEEKAIKFRKDYKQEIIDNDDFEMLDKFDVNVERAYIAGAKENEIVWHNLQKDPDDLPECGKEVRVAYHPFLPICQDEDEFEECNGVYKADEPLWLIDDHVYPADDVIAWCELPKFNIKE